jgi:adrenodoxin-NADP+ reductase
LSLTDSNLQNCQDKFNEVANSPKFNFIGNIDIGRDLPLASLIPHYDACLFAYGASKDRRLGITGEETVKEIYSARAFVGWYNGLPEYADLNPKLDNGEEAVIIGQGNVALDVARTLLSDMNRLKITDITEHALEVLSKSKIRRIHIVGRRGPMQASFTIKEVRELMNLPDVGLTPIDSSLLPPNPSTLPRSQKRMVQLLSKGSSTDFRTAPKTWSLDFLLAPEAFTGTSNEDGALKSIRFGKTEFQDDSDPFDTTAKVRRTSKDFIIPASAAFRSIGYKSEAIPGMEELGIPFDDVSGTIPNEAGGRILAMPPNHESGSSKHVPGMYCTGWVKNGPTGVIATTMEDAFGSAEAIAQDWEAKISVADESRSQALKMGWDSLKTEAVSKSLNPISWEDWLKIDKAEKERGRVRGKEREKFTSIEDMLNVIR